MTTKYSLTLAHFPLIKEQNVLGASTEFGRIYVAEGDLYNLNNLMASPSDRAV
jgi:hypothetical protein